MTIIAIFSILSETSAAVSLPYLDEESQKIYVWFLIGFPFYLILLFFVTLNFNHKSLYAPSDFAKEKHFIKAMDEPTSASKDKGPDIDSSPPPFQSATSPPLKFKKCKPQSCILTPTQSLARPRKTNESQEKKTKPNHLSTIKLSTAPNCQYNITLSTPLRNLQIIDTQLTTTQIALNKQLSDIEKAISRKSSYTDEKTEESSQVIILLASNYSEQSIRTKLTSIQEKNAFNQRAVSLVVYNTQTQAITVCDCKSRE